VANPKDDGYRALHLTNRNRSRLIEVQLRTPFQDNWANAVEADARLLSPGLKFGGGAQELRDFYIALGELGAQAEGGGPIDPAVDRWGVAARLVAGVQLHQCVIGEAECGTEVERREEDGADQ